MIVVAHVVDNLTILTSNFQLKLWTINGIRKYYSEITIQDDLENILGLEVSRDRSAKTITLKQECGIHNCLNAHFPEWSSTPMDELPQCPLPPTLQAYQNATCYWMKLHHLMVRELYINEKLVS